MLSALVGGLYFLFFASQRSREGWLCVEIGQ